MKKFLLLTVLAGGVAMVWIPDLRAALPAFLTGQTEASPSTDLGEVGVITDAFDPLGLESGIDMGNPIATTNAQTVPTDPSAMLRALRNFKASRVSLAPATAVAGPETESADPTHLDIFAEWDARIQARPLTAIMIHPTGNRAMFGGLSFEEGDEPLPGIKIIGIDQNSVVLSDGEVERAVTLPEIGSFRKFTPRKPAQTKNNPTPGSEFIPEEL